MQRRRIPCNGTVFDFQLATFTSVCYNDIAYKSICFDYGSRKVTGVPPGLQNQCWALTASWVGSIPTCSRQKITIFIYKESGFSVNPLFDYWLIPVFRSYSLIISRLARSVWLSIPSLNSSAGTDGVYQDFPLKYSCRSCVLNI